VAFEVIVFIPNKLGDGVGIGVTVVFLTDTGFTPGVYEVKFDGIGKGDSARGAGVTPTDIDRLGPGEEDVATGLNVVPMKGWINASSGVILLSGLRVRHRSKKSLS
jgi:hypothetical protein